jgi:hypothetical protein
MHNIALPASTARNRIPCQPDERTALVIIKFITDSYKKSMTAGNLDRSSAIRNTFCKQKNFCSTTEHSCDYFVKGITLKGVIMKRILCTAALIAATGGALIPLQANAQVGVSVVIGNRPPPVRYEPVPPPRAGYIWAPGYWNWDGRRHIWAGGHWEQVHNYREYRPAQWRHGQRGWELDRGGWYDRPGRHHYNRHHHR